MEKGTDPSLFVNDGSFMERFKHLQQEKQEQPAVSADPKPSVSTGSSTLGKPALLTTKRPLEIKSSDGKKLSSSASKGKLAFSLKQKSKIVAPVVKLDEDDEEDRGDMGYGSSEDLAKRQKLGASYVSQPPLHQEDVAPPLPNDPTVKNAADKLASFVAKNGRHFEHVTRQKNPGDTPFKFLFDSSCSDYKYYEYKLHEEENALAQKCSQATNTVTASNTAFRSSTISQKSPIQQHSNYQTPASALYEFNEDATPSGIPVNGDFSGHSPSDPIARMEFYMKKAAQEERKRPPKYSKDEMPPPASLQGPGKKGHHMGDYIPPDELQKFLATCNDAAARKAAHEAAERAKIQADNIGHKLLSKMGWREGEGLGSNKSGRADPVMAGDVKKDHLGVGARQPGEVAPDDDIYEQYKKRMMLGYRYRPNPLGNPRKSYY